MFPSFDYVQPASLESAIAHLADPGAVLHAGGTDLLGCLRERIFQVRKVVSISALHPLQGIAENADGTLRIGALATIGAIATHPLLAARCSALAQAAGEVASPQLRNQGTIGGNLCQKPRCWYYRGDFNCLRKGGGVCFAADGENQYHAIFGGGRTCFIVHPPPAAGTRSRYRKVRARSSWDFALASLALALRFDGRRVVDGRVVLGGAAPVPWRCTEVEQVLSGKELSPGVIASAAKAAVAGAEPLEKNGYKVELFQAVIEEELARIGGTA